MVKIFFYEGPFSHGEAGHDLIRRAFRQYCEEGAAPVAAESDTGDTCDACDTADACSDDSADRADDCNSDRENVNKLVIQVDDKGKPYFRDIPVHFSLSHTGAMWMCAFSEMPCGLDVQETKKRDTEKIAGRIYTEEEKRYAQLWGEEGFFEVWVRKEALAKYTGEGLFAELPSVVTEDHDLKAEIEVSGDTVNMYDVELLPEIKCALCSPDEDGWEVSELI